VAAQYFRFGLLFHTSLSSRQKQHLSQADFASDVGSRQAQSSTKPQQAWSEPASDVASLIARLRAHDNRCRRCPRCAPPYCWIALRERIRLLNYNRRTDDIHVHRSRTFNRFHGICHPKEMGAAEVEAFLVWLFTDGQEARATHKQTLSALIFLYAKVLEVQLPWMAEIGRSRVQRRLPVVLSKDEAAAVFRSMEGEHLPPKIHPFPRGVATARMCRQARGRYRCHWHGALQLRSPGLGSGGAGGPRRNLIRVG
jgi:hypothetical protein